MKGDEHYKISANVIDDITHRFITRIFEISSYSYCPDECWLSFIGYSLISIDTFTNILCILLSFKTDGVIPKYP